MNWIVTIYLDFAELQAINRTATQMSDWVAKLDDFLKLSGREVLATAGSISTQAVAAIAELEYEQYRKQQDAL